ncbi:YdcF family protein [Paenibacillus sp. 481]|uniref:YdcF family protein n=1 Tax=Paenibacillus sp. 481 TaxID=2835869 RepID=UPI001E36D7BD|nr:YdcF family protein [Paenibacillus sp. 481]
MGSGIEQQRTSSESTVNIESALHAKQRSKPWLKRLLSIGGSLLFSAIIWLSFTQWKIAQEGGPYKTTHADVGIVLGASLWGDEPSPGLKERLDYTLQLYESGRFKNIIVTGGLDTPQSRLSEAEGMAAYLIKKGIPEDRIWLEKKSTSTLENLKFSQPFLEQQGWSSATIVTHDFHATRAYEIATSLGYAHPTVESTESRVLSTVWHFSRESLAYTKWKWDQLWLM